MTVRSNRSKIRTLTQLSMCVSVALLLSYVELLIPPIYSAIPGIKMGLPNVAIIFVLYRFGVREAAAVSLVRLAVVAMLFGNPMTLIYSLAGAALSLLGMALLRRTDLFSTVGVSIAGGVLHNLGQILVAMLLLSTAEIGYYMIVLAVTGTVSGALVGLCGAFAVARVPHPKS